MDRRTVLLGMLGGALGAGSAARAQGNSFAGVELRRDVEYLEPGRAEKLDLYLPAERPAGMRFPAVVIIHGGGWRGGDKGANREINIGTTLARAGYVCASVNYHLADHAPWPRNLHDCKNAVRFLRVKAGEYAVDPGRIGVIGGSAGGHLALMVGLTGNMPSLAPAAPYPGVPDHVHAIVNMYGLANLFTRQETDADGTPNGILKETGLMLIGKSRAEAAEQWKQASPVTHITPQSPPVLILHGKNDTTVDWKQSTELAAALKRHGVEHQLLLLDGVGHTFDLQTWNRRPLPTDLRPVVTNFFDQYVKHRA